MSRKGVGTCCCAVGCSMRTGTNLLSQIKMFMFPKCPQKRQAWIHAVRRKDWSPKKSATICSKHFIEGRPHSHPEHPDYVPSIFVFNSKGEKEGKKKLKQFERKYKVSKFRDASLENIQGMNSKGKPSCETLPLTSTPSIVVLNQKPIDQVPSPEARSRLIRIESKANCPRHQESLLNSNADKIHKENLCKNSVDRVDVTPDIPPASFTTCPPPANNMNLVILPQLPSMVSILKKEVGTMTDFSINDLAKMEKDLEDLKQLNLEMALRISKHWP